MIKLHNSVNENIRYYRNKFGITQAELAEKADTSPNYIGCIEIGKKNPSPQMLAKIAKAFGIDESELLKEN